MNRHRWFYALTGLLSVLAILVLADVAQAQAQTAEARLSFSKTASATEADVGDTITFTLDVQNSGGLDSSSMTFEDFLPAGNWVIGTHSPQLACSIGEGKVLFCEPFIVPASFIDENNDKINGDRFVTVKSIVRTCGPLINDGYLVNQRTGDLTIRSATVNVRCPVSPTATPTQTPVPPTQTPVPSTATPTLNDPVPTRTPTIIRIVPLPPNTGNAQASRTADDHVSTYLLVVFGVSALAVLGLCVTRLAVARKR